MRDFTSNAVTIVDGVVPRLDPSGPTVIFRTGGSGCCGGRAQLTCPAEVGVLSSPGVARPRTGRSVSWYPRCSLSRSAGGAVDFDFPHTKKTQAADAAPGTGHSTRRGRPQEGRPSPCRSAAAQGGVQGSGGCRERGDPARGAQRRERRPGRQREPVCGAARPVGPTSTSGASAAQGSAYRARQGRRRRYVPAPDGGGPGPSPKRPAAPARPRRGPGRSAAKHRDVGGQTAHRQPATRRTG